MWDNPDEIDFESLPNQFVLKVNWCSGQNIIVKDKSKLNIEETKEKLRNWLKPVKNHYENCTREIPRPKNFAMMLELSKKLSSDFPLVRVDLFEIEDKIYFGELTFYHFNGIIPFEPREWNYKFGDMIDIESLIKGEKE